MGNLAALPLHDMVPKYGLSAFVETGTWLGAGIAFARCFADLLEFHSVDVCKDFYEHGRKMFGFDRLYP